MPDTPLTEAQRALMEANLHLAERSATAVFRRWRSGHTTHSLDELTSFAYLGLARAVARFKPELGDFAHFAFPYIKGEINNGLRADSPLSRRDRQRAYLDRRLAHEAASGLPPEVNTQERLLLERAAPPQLVDGVTQVSAQGPGIETVVDRNAKIEKILALAAEADFTPREREVFNFHFFADRDLVSIARLLEVGRSNISKRHAAALGKLIEAAREQNLLD